MNYSPAPIGEPDKALITPEELLSESDEKRLLAGLANGATFASPLPAMTITATYVSGTFWPPFADRAQR